MLPAVSRFFLPQLVGQCYRYHFRACQRPVSVEEVSLVSFFLQYSFLVSISSPSQSWTSEEAEEFIIILYAIIPAVYLFLCGKLKKSGHFDSP